VTESTESNDDRAMPAVDAVPEGLSSGSTVLVASVGDPTRHALTLQILSAVADGADRALVVTTTESAERTTERSRAVFEDETRPSFGVVDTVSRQQSVAARYGDVPTVFTPSPSDLERLVVALSELTRDEPPTDGDRHLLVRSLTPTLDAVATDQVCAVLQQISGIRTEAGLTLLGIDEIAHDEATMRALAERVDGILWAAMGSDDTLELTYRPTTGRLSMGSGPACRE
jgi:KaiC/GvpD/RAD55 family RecA-like ATPase